jgi:hypothetical protein
MLNARPALSITVCRYCVEVGVGLSVAGRVLRAKGERMSRVLGNGRRSQKSYSHEGLSSFHQTLLKKVVFRMLGFH